jgi:hypothetical protein
MDIRPLESKAIESDKAADTSNTRPTLAIWADTSFQKSM